MKTRLVKVLVCCICLMLIVSVTGCRNNAAKKPTETNPNNVTDTNQTTTLDSDRRMMADRISNQAASVTGVKKAYVVIADAETTNVNTPGTVNNPTAGTTGTNATSNATSPNPAAGTTNQTTQTATQGMTDTGNLTGGTAPATTAQNRYVALIGIEVNENDSAKRQEIVNQVREKVRNSETGLTDVLVSTDSSMIKRIQDMAAGILNGTAVGTTTELNRLRDDLRAAGNDLATGTRDAVTGVTNAVKDATGMNR